MNAVPDMPIEELGLSSRLVGILKRAGCRSVADVATRWPAGILRINWIGPVLMQELHHALVRLIPDLLPVPKSPRPRRRADVTAQHTRDQRMQKLERDRIALLNMFLRGMTSRQIAEQHRCSRPAVYARKRRLLLHYARPPYFERLPDDLRGFVLAESHRFLIGRLARHSEEGRTGGTSNARRLPRRPQLGLVQP